MRKIVLTLFVVMSALAVVAQDLSPAIDTARKRPVTSFNNTILSESKFSHTTSKGKVHILPYDNMPCLVPNMHKVTPMPGSVQPQPNSKMPNALPRRKKF